MHGSPQTIVSGSSPSFYGQLPQMEHSELPPQAHSSTTLHLAQLGLQMHIYGSAITQAQVAHARLNKQGHRPLGRTQSAPLPLGHPMLTGVNMNVAQTHYENSDAERQAYEQQHLLLTQKIRQTVLTRSGAISAAVAAAAAANHTKISNCGLIEPVQSSSSLSSMRAKNDTDTNEVIDLTDKKLPPKTILTSSLTTGSLQSLPEERIRDHEYLQQQREILMRQSMQV